MWQDNTGNNTNRIIDEDHGKFLVPRHGPLAQGIIFVEPIRSNDVEHAEEATCARTTLADSGGKIRNTSERYFKRRQLTSYL